MNPHLQSGGRVRDDISCVPERPARLVLALRRDHLRPRVAGSLGLGGHGAHQLLGHPDILHLDNILCHVIIDIVMSCDMTYDNYSIPHLYPLHSDAPGVGGLVQQVLHLPGDGLASQQYPLIMSRVITWHVYICDVSRASPRDSWCQARFSAWWRTAAARWRRSRPPATRRVSRPAPAASHSSVLRVWTNKSSVLSVSVDKSELAQY